MKIIIKLKSGDKFEIPVSNDLISLKTKIIQKLNSEDTVPTEKKRSVLNTAEQLYDFLIWLTQLDEVNSIDVLNINADFKNSWHYKNDLEKAEEIVTDKNNSFTDLSNESGISIPTLKRYRAHPEQMASAKWKFINRLANFN